MSDQLLDIVAIAKKHGLTVWLNHGTLLGLMREGRLLEHDLDIDISMWAEDEDRFLAALPDIRALDYKVTVWSYRGMNFQYKFTPKENSGLRRMDLHLMRKAGDYAWRPQPGLVDNPFRGILSRPYGLFTRMLWRYVFVCHRLTGRVSLSSWPIRNCLQIGTCWTPAHFFENLTKHEEWDCYIPKDWDAYLTFKYDDWRTPVKQWDWWTQEGGLIHKEPKVLIEEMERQRMQEGTERAA